jgi:hypothetical protein
MRNSGSVFRAYDRNRFRRALTLKSADDPMEKPISSVPVELRTIGASACFIGTRNIASSSFRGGLQGV